MNTISRTLFLITVLLFITQNFLLAQSVQSDIKNLSQGADMIITGQVVSQQSQWNSDNSRIYTQVTIKVDEYLKGSDNQDRIVITHLGGEVGNVGETYSHIPTFTDDENVLVFVKKSAKDESLSVFEGEEGKLTLYQNKNTGEEVTSKNVKASELKKEIKKFVEMK
jgi:hypothetical protein